MTNHRTILHIDMNAFFASVEQAANPALRGKPIAVVGGHGRTVITTSSYEARAKGVKTGMAIWEGKRTCPELIIGVGDNRKYTHTSTRINEIFRDYTPEVEAFSIDDSLACLEKHMHTDNFKSFVNAVSSLVEEMAVYKMTRTE